MKGVTIKWNFWQIIMTMTDNSQNRIACVTKWSYLVMFVKSQHRQEVFLFMYGVSNRIASWPSTYFAADLKTFLTRSSQLLRGLDSVVTPQGLPAIFPPLEVSTCVCLFLVVSLLSTVPSSIFCPPPLAQLKKFGKLIFIKKLTSSLLNSCILFPDPWTLRCLLALYYLFASSTRGHFYP